VVVPHGSDAVVLALLQRDDVAGGGLDVAVLALGCALLCRQRELWASGGILDTTDVRTRVGERWGGGEGGLSVVPQRTIFRAVLPAMWTPPSSKICRRMHPRVTLIESMAVGFGVGVRIDTGLGVRTPSFQYAGAWPS